MDNQAKTCANCNDALPNVSPLYFCPNCSWQVHCKSCDAAILPKAKVCVNCGTAVKQIGSMISSDTVMNEVDFEQKGNHKKFKSRFTNEVGAPLAETIAFFMGGNVQFRKPQNVFGNAGGKLLGSKQIENKPASSQPIEEAIVLTDAEYGELLQRFFTIEDNKLKLLNSRLKQTGKLDQAIRLALLSLYAFEKADQPQIEKSVLAEIITSIGRYDAHFQSWLSKCDEVRKDGNKISLTVPGRESAEKILNELADDSITIGSVTFSRVGKKARRNKKTDSNGDGTGSVETTKGKSSKGPMYYLDTLIREGFFSKKKKLGEIIEHLKVNKAESYKQQELSTPLKRAIKSEKLKREKNSDGQYEYFA